MSGHGMTGMGAHGMMKGVWMWNDGGCLDVELWVMRVWNDDMLCHPERQTVILNLIQDLTGFRVGARNDDILRHPELDSGSHYNLL